MNIAPYGSWKSPITSDLIVGQSIGLSEVRLDGDDIYWLESRPHEKGRSVVVRNVRGGAYGEDITPEPFNVRSRVHEYGGGAWVVSQGTLFFSNMADGRLFRMERGSHWPYPLTPEGPWRFADGLIDTRRHRWIGIREDHSAGTGMPDNAIVWIDADHGSMDHGGTVLASGHDFYSSPQLSPDGRWLAFLSWSHPNMPWTGTNLYVLQLGQDGMPVGEPISMAGGPEESLFQPMWSPDGKALFYISDRTGWWNIYRQQSRSPAEAILPKNAEFGQPQWVFGMSTYAFAGANRIVCSWVSEGLGHLATVDLSTAEEGGGFRTVTVDQSGHWTEFSSVRALESRLVFRAGSATRPASIVFVNLDTGAVDVLKKATDVADDPDIAKYFSEPQSLQFPTSGDRTAFGLYYPVRNPDYAAPDEDLPPLLVKCHGGPTAAANSTLDLRIQYWTSRGIAVLDVNYGGSTGYGREYRNRLNSNWGITDVEDCVSGARYLADQGHVDRERSVISGGSAGGYTVLAALTFHDYFRGGASHYGVSDLAVLAQDTHKFESHYLESLVGPYPEKEDLYRERSPIAHAGRLSVPVIFFQGDEDMVVPPNQTELMVKALRSKGTPAGYLLFSGEQHGFRKAENIRRTLDAELLFYAVNVFRVGLAF